MTKKTVVTMGDPAGIGPYVVLEALKKISLTRNKISLIGDAKILSRFTSFDAIRKDIDFIDMANSKGIRPGKSSAASGKASYEYLEKAVELLRANPNQSLVTAPVSKEAVSQSIGAFVGHTEYLAESFDVDDVVMLMKGKKMSVVLLTRHVFLRDVPDMLDVNDIYTTINLVGESFKDRFGVKKPKFALCSVNPHAGIETFLEHEELLLLKAVAPLAKKYDIYGPYPSDTIFHESDFYDVIFAAYHDQAMIPFKLQEFSSGINVTLGLPFLRTSPAHGTAYSLVKTPEKVDSRSMLNALRFALKA